jgi:hypothetical protein
LLRVQLLRVQLLRVQLPAAFNASRLIACGVQLLRVQLPAAFNCFVFKGLIACGMQRFNS